MAELYRLTPAVYEALEKQLPRPILSSNSTELEAGQIIGIQRVLELLRNGFTINDSNQARGIPLGARKG